jgi:hypothetical protein
MRPRVDMPVLAEDCRRSPNRRVLIQQRFTLNQELAHTKMIAKVGPCTSWKLLPTKDSVGSSSALARSRNLVPPTRTRTRVSLMAIKQPAPSRVGCSAF